MSGGGDGDDQAKQQKGRNFLGREKQMACFLLKACMFQGEVFPSRS